MLGFLCSRLLGATKPVRDRKAKSKLLASECAVVVQTRNKVVDAAMVLQRAWRKYRKTKLMKLQKGELDIWMV